MSAPHTPAPGRTPPTGRTPTTGHTPLAFGLGPVPGTTPADFEEAADIILSETPLPHIPQLPARGVGSDAVGRTAALLDIPIDRGPRGWRVAPRPSTRAMYTDRLERDLDILEELWAGKTTQVKTQLVGPWTLAAEIEMANGHRMITDPGALRDITEALVEAVAAHRRSVEKRLAPTVLQLDEPRLADIMRGTLPGTTEFETIPAFPEPEERLAPFEALLNAPLLIDVPWQTAKHPDNQHLDQLARLLDRGSRVAFPAMPRATFLRLFDELQLDPAECALDVYATAGTTLAETATSYRAAREMAEGIR
ncbi:methionine synthase [Corynebacterium aquatimens]|uniref:methionine synthase n=1 Tax=Corynebacterium TaxID=1716 RepID=UPI001F1656EE|nr:MULTISPECIES: methionine synthase [Corynebacterium]QYH19861.1 methionine synthase [Corynebacterium aquatimens]UIZ92987.1 methionine synthase [Corynebacterium sp. CNCTC7651]